MTMLQVAPAEQTQTVLMATIKRLLRRYLENRNRRRSLAQLKSVDPRTLRDMGIDRSEVTSIVYGDPRERRRQCTEKQSSSSPGPSLVRCDAELIDDIANRRHLRV